MAKARLLLHDRFEFNDGKLIEVVVWRVPVAVPPTDHGFKYSLFYGGEQGRDVGYDNERGKGDHRHLQGVESPYVFSTVEQLIEDFWADVEALRGEQ